MRDYPRVRAAAQSVGRSLWGLVDAIGAEARTNADGRLLDGELSRLVEALAEEGVDYTEARVRRFWLVARASLARDALLRTYPVRYAEEAVISLAVGVERAEAVLAGKPREYWTLRKFHTALTGRPWTNSPEDATAEQRDVLVRRAIAENPERVARQVAADPGAAKAVEDALNDQYRRRVEERSPRRGDLPAKAPGEDFWGPSRTVGRLHSDFLAIKREAQDWTPEQRRFAAERLEAHRHTVPMLIDMLNGLDDAALDALLGGEGR